MEHCLNPWKEKCDNEEIKVYIQLNGENLPICRTCWQKIADSDREWGNAPKPNFNIPMEEEKNE